MKWGLSEEHVVLLPWAESAGICLSVCVCMYVHTYVHVRMHMCQGVCARVSICARTHVCVCAWAFAWFFVS